MARQMELKSEREKKNCQVLDFASPFCFPTMQSVDSHTGVSAEVLQSSPAVLSTSSIIPAGITIQRNKIHRSMIQGKFSQSTRHVHPEARQPIAPLTHPIPPTVNNNNPHRGIFSFSHRTEFAGQQPSVLPYRCCGQSRSRSRSQQTGLRAWLRLAGAGAAAFRKEV